MKSNQLTKNLALLAEQRSLSGGGRVKPLIRFKKAERGYELTFGIPGLDPQYLGLEIHNLSLQFYQKHDFGAKNGRPILLEAFRIPIDVALDEIVAEMDEHKLIVSLPYNQFAGGYHRRVDTRN